MLAGGTRALGLCLCLGYGCSDAAERQTQTIDDVTAAEADAQAMAMSEPDASPVERDAGASRSDCASTWGECASGPLDAWGVIARASDFGAGATFEALAADLVLVRGGGLPWRVLRFAPDLAKGVPGKVTSFGFPAGSWVARGLAHVAASNGPRALVLACEVERDQCVLLEAELASASALRERAGSVLPATFSADGLAANELRTCAYGDGVICLQDGAWSTSLPLPQGERVLALALDGARALALSSQGRVFTLDGAWREDAPVTDATRVAAAGAHTTFYGETSFVERTVGVDDTMCAFPEGVSALFLSHFGARRSLLTAGGNVLRSSDRAAGYCRTDRVALDGPVRAASSGACGLGDDLRVITAGQLLGDNRCDLE